MSKAEGTRILAVRISNLIDLKLDKLVKYKMFPSKADIIRTAIIEYLNNHKTEFEKYWG